MVSPAELASMKSALENALTLCAAERRSASDYVALAQAVIRLTACVPGSDAYVQERVALAELLGQSNTYSTWSLSLKSSALLHRRLLYTASATQPDLSPAELGVTETSTPAFLKAPDLPLILRASPHARCWTIQMPFWAKSSRGEACPTVAVVFFSRLCDTLGARPRV